MKKFEKDGKINFVDENNVFVGYDLEQSCCENADWFISNKKEDKIYDDNVNSLSHEQFDIESYNFDPKFFEDISGEQFDSGAMVRFRLIAEDKQDLFLHLYNCHNGYYGHGFEAKIGDESWKEGTL